MFRCNLPPPLQKPMNDRALLRVIVVTRGWKGHRIRVNTQSYLWRRKVFSAPAGFRTRNLSITSPALYQQAIAANTQQQPQDEQREITVIDWRDSYNKGHNNRLLNRPGFFLCYFFFFFLQLYCPNGISTISTFGLPPPGKASCDRVALPNLWSMLGVLVFP